MKNELRQCECGEDIDVNFRVVKVWHLSRDAVGVAYCERCGRGAPFRLDGYCLPKEANEKAIEAWNERIED